MKQIEFITILVNLPLGTEVEIALLDEKCTYIGFIIKVTPGYVTIGSEGQKNCFNHLRIKSIRKVIKRETTEAILIKHCPELQHLFSDETTKEFKKRVILAMEEYKNQK